jgi:uncharacterized membrane protein YecN with MAPEG domain
MRITGLYAAILALWMMFLATRVVLLRNRQKVGLGDGGDSRLLRAIRTHGNAVEYVPVGLLLLLVVEINQTVPWIVHGFGVLLVLGRLAHANGLGKSSGYSVGRAVGFAFTFLAIVGMALLLIWQYLMVHAIAVGA